MWNAVALYWTSLCLGRGFSVPGFGSAWAKLKKMLKDGIKKRFGESRERARLRMPYVHVEPELAGTKWEPYARALKALSEEAERREDTDFIAAYNLISDLVGSTDHKKTQRYVGAISDMGYISVLRAGQPGTAPGRDASEWSLWYDPPIPGKTIWNNNKAMGMSRTRQQTDLAMADGDDSTPVALDNPTTHESSRLLDEIEALFQEASERSTWDELVEDAEEPGLTDPTQSIADGCHSGWSFPFDRYDFEECAAIMEYDGGLSREEAERRAVSHLLERWQALCLPESKTA